MSSSFFFADFVLVLNAYSFSCPFPLQHKTVNGHLVGVVGLER